MNRYLLFDSGCSLCTDLAHAIERKSDGWLAAKSLRDEAMQSLLTSARPGWRWEPTLLEINGTHVRVFTGRAMYWRMATGLGLRRSWRIAQLVQTAGTPRPPADPSRRNMLRQVSAVVATAALLPFGGSAAAAKSDPRVHGRAHPLSRVPVTSSKKLEGEALAAAVQQVIDSSDVQNLVPGIAAASLSHIAAAHHTLQDGNHVTAVAAQLPDSQLLVWYKPEQTIGNYRSQAMLIRVVPGVSLSMAATSVNGTTRANVSTLPGQSIQCSQCADWDWACVESIQRKCGSCTGSCGRCFIVRKMNVCGGCLTCLLTYCLGYEYSSCCRRWASSVTVPLG